MAFRVTESANAASLKERIGAANQRVALYRERLASNKRINKPSDDPGGAAAVLNLKTTQGAIERFQRNATVAQTDLLIADGTLETYQVSLDRARNLVTSGAGDTQTTTSKQAIANELDLVRANLIAIANTQSGGTYVFGGTRQGVPPFDPATGVPAATPTTRQTLQLEPNAAPIAVGVTADATFSDANGSIFDALTQASAAFRGTGDPVADAATVKNVLGRISSFTDLASVSRSQLGGSLDSVQSASDRLGVNSIQAATQIDSLEAADFADTAVGLTSAQQALDAILQSSGTTNRRTLIDFLG